MLNECIPGFGELVIEHLVLDLNGTLTFHGEWIEGVETRLRSLSERLTIHLLTADTFGVAAARVAALPVRLTILGEGDQARQKAAYIGRLGPVRCVAVGNGRNDVGMLARARLGIAVIEGEGCASEALRRADLVCRHITDALDLLLHPLRLRATLRR